MVVISIWPISHELIMDDRVLGRGLNQELEGIGDIVRQWL